MITGVNPGKHGVFDFAVMDTAYRRMAVQPMRKLAVDPLWRILNERGIETGIVNLPILYPPEPVRGYMLCGVVTPSDAQVFTYPEELSYAIGNPGENWIIGEHLIRGDALELVVREVREKTSRQADVAVDLLDKSRTPFVMIVFDGTDRLQHFLWKYWDSTHPRHEPEASAELRSAIPEYYVELDAHLSRIVERVGRGNIFIVSDHGFAGLSKGFYIEQWLLQQGYMHLKPPAVVESNRVLGNLVRGMWGAATELKGLRGRVKSSRLMHGVVKKARSSLYDRGRQPSDYVDWSKTKVFHDALGLRVNVRGRQESGIVNEGQEYADLVEEVRAHLLEVVDPEWQRPVIRRAYRRDEVYHGSRTQEAQDVIVESSEGYRFVDGFPNCLLGPPSEYGKDLCGDHRREGIFIASGPDVRRTDSPIEAEIVDIMPTVLYLNHLPIPAYVDGTVIAPVILETFQRENPVQYTDAYGLPAAQSEGYTEEERAVIEERLRALGYL
jgi:predicted AlkP superfamily phosphohydrolase/phosphomutase